MRLPACLIFLTTPTPPWEPPLIMISWKLPLVNRVQAHGKKRGSFIREHHIGQERICLPIIFKMSKKIIYNTGIRILLYVIPLVTFYYVRDSAFLGILRNLIQK